MSVVWGRWVDRWMGWWFYTASGWLVGWLARGLLAGLFVSVFRVPSGFSLRLRIGICVIWRGFEFDEIRWDNTPPYRGHCVGLIRKLKSPESNYSEAKCGECVILDIHDVMGAFCNPKK